jgi:muramidase (phage lysozyme)
MAVELIREGPALEALMSGNFDEAVSRLGFRQAWASFPYLRNGSWRPNPSGQFTHDIQDLRAHYQEALSRYSRSGPGLVGTAAGLRQ